jgi:hypothetical protein
MAATTLQAPPAPSGPPPAAAYRPATLSDALLSEWTKIRTLRSTFFTLVATVAFVVGLGALISYESSVHYSPGDGLWDPTSMSLSGLVIGQLTIAVLGVLAITGEYGTGMIRTSLAAVPRRGRLLAAKAGVFGAVALVTGELVSWVAFFVGQLLISGHEPTASLSQPDVARAVVGGGLYIALIGLMAVAAGTILRHTAAESCSCCPGCSRPSPALGGSRWRSTGPRGRASKSWW